MRDFRNAFKKSIMHRHCHNEWQSSFLYCISTIATPYYRVFTNNKTQRNISQSISINKNITCNFLIFVFIWIMRLHHNLLSGVQVWCNRTNSTRFISLYVWCSSLFQCISFIQPLQHFCSFLFLFAYIENQKDISHFNFVYNIHPLSTSFFLNVVGNLFLQ